MITIHSSYSDKITDGTYSSVIYLLDEKHRSYLNSSIPFKTNLLNIFKFFEKEIDRTLNDEEKIEITLRYV